MNVKLTICNVTSNNKISQVNVVIDESATIKQMLNDAEVWIADLSQYYKFSGTYSWNCSYLPYIISNEKVYYDVEFKDTKVIDFLYTHNILNNELYLITGYPLAGGPGFLELKDIWDQVYPILEKISTMLSLGIVFKNFIKWFCSCFKKRKRTPQVCFDILFSRQYWNHNDLAKLLNINAKKAKLLLQLFDYRYNKKIMLYEQGPKTEELKKQLLSIKVRNI